MNRIVGSNRRQIGVFAVTFATAGVLFAQAPPVSRDAWQRPDDIVSALSLTPGSRVADIGAGDGYFTTRLALAVGPDGRVLAVDIEQKMLDALKQLVEKEKLSNVDLILGAPDDPR